MNLSSQIALTAARLLRDHAQGYAGRALRLARRGADQTAERLEAEAPRFTALAEAGLRATEVSCRALDRLLRQGFDSARGAFADSAERLRITARAESFGALYAAQRATLPASRDRVVKELEATWRIVVSTSRELAEVARSARHELARGAGRGGRGRSRTGTPRRSKRAARRPTGGTRSG
jgi:hypothetical protein